MSLDLPLREPVLQFTLLVLIAFAARRLFESLHVPGLVGLMLAGMFLGPGGAHVLPFGDVIELLGEVGLVYIMFQAGMEIDLEIVRRRRRETISFGLLAFGCSLIPAVAAAMTLLDYGFAAALMLGTLLSSHTLVAYPLVARLKLLHHPPVVTAVGGTLITDTLALILLVIVLQTAGQGGDHGTGPWWVALILLALLAAAALSLIPRYGSRFLSRDLLRAERALAVLAVVLVLASAADMIGTEKILGAFIAGVSLNRPLKENPELLEHLEFAGRMLFIPFFFIETGMRLELAVFADASRWWLAALLLLLVVMGKSLGSWLTGGLFGFSRWSRVLMTGLTIPQAAATLAVTISARRAGLFEQDVVDAVIVLIFITCLAGPLLTRFSGQRVLRAQETRE